jgi:cathepsin H
VTCLFRYGKEYETVEEMKLRFEIFSENLKLIRSTNRKGLSYKLAVNRKHSFSFLFWPLDLWNLGV